MEVDRRSLMAGRPPSTAASHALAIAPRAKDRLIFDMHSHVETPPARTPDGGYDIADDLAFRNAILDRLGFTASVLMARQNYDRPNGVADTRKQNDFVAWYRDTNRIRYPVGLGNIEPSQGAAACIAEVRRMKDQLKLDGVIFHNSPQGRYMDDPAMIAAAREMGRHGMPCFVHLNIDNLLESPFYLEALATACPDTTFIGIGAFSRIGAIQGMRLVGKLCRNVMFETTGYWQKGRALSQFVKMFGSERIVFGTDMNALPSVVYHWPQGLLDILELPDLTERDRRNILWDNAQRLFPALKSLRGGL